MVKRSCKARKRWGAEVFERLFVRNVEQCVKAGFCRWQQASCRCLSGSDQRLTQLSHRVRWYSHSLSSRAASSSMMTCSSEDTFDIATLLESARQELAPAKPEQFKIFLLAAMAGLRRNEIDKLPWTAFRWDEGVIRIQATESSGQNLVSQKATCWLIPNSWRSFEPSMRGPGAGS
jgi:hypothetical protein